jgi:hypothetical protein
MPNPTINEQPPDLPNDVAILIADAADVPDKEREAFCDLLCFNVRLVWERDRRAIGGSAGAALVRAADAARTLHEALDNLDARDREWLERLWAKTPRYKRWLQGVQWTAFQLAHLLSVAAGKAPPPNPGETTRPKGGRRKGSVKDVIFLDFARRLLIATADCGGDLTVENERSTGSLIDALNILREHLPKGVVPLEPPGGTLQRIKANPHGYYTPLYDIDIFDLPEAK